MKLAALLAVAAWLLFAWCVYHGSYIAWAGSVSLLASVWFVHCWARQDETMAASTTAVRLPVQEQDAGSNPARPASLSTPATKRWQQTDAHLEPRRARITKIQKGRP